MHHVIALDDVLKRDITVLATLAQLYCATVHQLHALCFPNHTVATVRLTLYYLAEAHFIARSRWKLKRQSQECGQIWILTAKGYDLLRRYVPLIPPLVRVELGRPNTALEHEEWRVRILVRTLVVRLLLEARRTPLLYGLGVQLPGTASWPSAWSQVPQSEPDAVVSIVWEPAKRHTPDWLPWIDGEPLPAGTVQYPIYVERTHARADIANLSSIWAELSPYTPQIPLMILANEERCEEICQQLATLKRMPTIRMASAPSLQHGPVQSVWCNGHGVVCHLQALAEDQVQ